MSKLNNMRVIEIPKFRAVSSGVRPLDELIAEDSKFITWVNAHKALIKAQIYEPSDFLWHEGGDTDRSVWIFAINDNVTEADTAPYEIIEFPGGMFLVATGDEKNGNDLNETVGSMMAWINASDVFEYGDLNGMCNMPDPNGTVDRALGIAQQQIFLPIKFRKK